VSDVERLLIKAQPGCRVTVKEHIERGERIMLAIRTRFPEVKNVYGLKAKHARWLLKEWCSAQGHSETTRYHYFRTIRAIAAALDKWGRLGTLCQRPLGQTRPGPATKTGQAPSQNPLMDT